MFINKRFVNKSVYYKYANNILFNPLSTIQVLDVGLIPDKFKDGNVLKSESKIIKLFAGVWNDPSYNKVPCKEINQEACRYQVLLGEIIRLYTQLHMAYNYINSEKCSCYDIPIKYSKAYRNVYYNWQLDLGNKKIINIREAHDLYVYLFSKVRNSNNKFVLQSQFYKFVMICCKLQKYIYSNFRERDNCHVTIDSNKNKNKELSVPCNPENYNKY
jgi:hypothetical protein